MTQAANPQDARSAVYIVDYARSPFLKAKGKPGPFHASDLAVQAGRELLSRQNFPPEDIDEVIVGCVMPSADEVNIARVIALRLGCGKTVPAWTVQRNCASGLQAIDSAYQDIVMGRSNLVLAGGTDAMSQAPILYNEAMVNWLAVWAGAKTIGNKLKALAQFRLKQLSPVISLLRGLTDPVVNLSMGQTAENLAFRFGITRQEMDAYALRSHQRAAQAQQENQLAKVISLFDNQGNLYSQDDGVRPDSSMEKLATLKPIFDRHYGAVTPGNSSQVTDGAALLLLASEAAVKRYKLQPIAKIIDVNWGALDPADMGLGPVHAITPLLQRQGLGMNEIDYWEINEAFAAQVIACLRAWQDKDYCIEHFGGLADAFGQLDETKLNIHGGAIALGHPVGASGARVTMELANILQNKKAKRGVASLCIGGGQGGAILIERVGE